MPAVRIPTPLRGLTGGASTVDASGDDVRAVVQDLGTRFPGLADRLLDDQGQLRRYVHVFVHDQDVRVQRGLDTPVDAGATVTIVPAVAGG